jgi:tape measure domain-containing protein
MRFIKVGFNAVSATGGGGEEFKRVAYGMQQVLSAGRFLQEDINIIREALPTAGRLMQEAFGANRAEDLQKLNISTREFVNGLVDAMEKLPQVGDTMGKQVGRLSTVWNDFKASLADSVLKDAFQVGVAGFQLLVKEAGKFKEGLQFATELMLGVYDPNESARKKAAADAAQAKLDAPKLAMPRYLTAEEEAEWKKENEKWREARKKTLEKAAEDERDYQMRVGEERADAWLKRMNENIEEGKQAYEETLKELAKMDEDAAAAAEAKIAAFAGIAEAKAMMEDKMSQNINEGIQNRLKSRSERRAENDEKRRFENAKKSEEAALAKKLLKEERDKFKENELENLKKGKLWNEELEKARAKNDARDAVRKATEDGAMTLKDILTVLKTLATA